MEFSTRKNGVRLLLLLAVVIGVAAVVQDLHFNNTLATGRSALRGTDGEVSLLQVRLVEFRSAQIGYLATGQNPDDWVGQTTDLSQQIQAGFARCRGSATSPEARARLGAAEAAWQQLLDVDGRARQAVADADTAAASHAIFTESPEAAARVASELASLRAAEIDAAERTAAAAARWRLGLSGGAMSLLLLLSIIAVRLSQQPSSGAATMAQMLRDLPPPVKSTSAGTTTAAASTALATPASSPTVALASPAPPAISRASPALAALPAVPHINLNAAAELCADLARVMDERDVPDLLARAARVLEASGLIIWMADTDGATLQPTLTHGYSDRVVSRLGTLDVEADNVTSLAFRSMRSQQISGNGAAAAGAIAVPLVTANGCTGVLAAELRETRMVADAVALARIIAAQFATIIAPTPAVEARAAEA